MLLFLIFYASLTCAWLLMPSIFNVNARLLYLVFECLHLP